jgi:hypothetical protein
MYTSSRVLQVSSNSQIVHLSLRPLDNPPEGRMRSDIMSALYHDEHASDIR